MQILPSPELRKYIKHYLFIDSQEPLHGELRIFADGNTGIVFCLQSLLFDADFKELPKVFTYGQITNYRTLTANGHLSFLVVVFRPFGMSSLLHIPARIMKNNLIDFEAIQGIGVRHLYDSLHEVGTKHGMTESLNAFFTERAHLSQTMPNPMVSASANWIMERKGIFRAEELVDFTGWQQRSIERAFNDVVGLSPKRLGGIIRLHHFLGCIRSLGMQGKFTPIVYDSGYYDQAHLIREFRKLTGLTPTAYHSIRNPFAVNVIGLPDENIQSQVRPV